ncbi:hypothetical protein V8D89_004871 [Ganoderma adspersum]
MARLASALLALPLLLATSLQAVGAASQPDITAYLNAHNSFRAQHGAAPLAWNDTLASAAQSWVDKCVFQHSGGAVGPYGENLAAGTGNYDIAAAIKGWTDEAPQYDPQNPQASHFTQVVWKATTQLGCAVKDGCTGIFDPKFGPAKFYACEYAPPGNVGGQFPYVASRRAGKF